MLHGTVSYTLNDGRKCEDVEWAARGTLVTAGDEVKWKSYQVYMVSTVVIHSNTKSLWNFDTILTFVGFRCHDAEVVKVFYSSNIYFSTSPS